jgi:exopolyphosphatase/guanosine-5'-triphosphate,3'-diphosphate pyrophosphatase
MAKRVAVIDIGSNSARLVIYQKTSRYGFHLLCRHKSRVRIGEGAYQRGGTLQPEPMDRAFETLKSFIEITRSYQTKKILCVATSALRDAPNRDLFLRRVHQKLGLRIRVIDGEEEARLGAIAAANLLPIRTAISIDIGGGSTDIAHIVDGQIVGAYSLDIGTVRLKELFTSKKGWDSASAEAFVREALRKLPQTCRSETAVAIGGTARAIGRGMMRVDDYPLDKLHAYTYATKPFFRYADALIDADDEKLDKLGIRPERFDTIRQGALILREVLRHLDTSRVVTSGVGVREGVYLNDFLRRDHLRFPKGVNPSIVSIRDRFDLPDLPVQKRHKTARKLFAMFARYFDGDTHDLNMITDALDLSQIGKMLTIYKEHQHAFYIAKHELNYGFTHGEMILIALILRSKGKKYHRQLYKEYRTLLPSKRKVRWLVFLYTLTLVAYEYAPGKRLRLTFEKGVLTLEGAFASYLAQEEVDAMEKPKEIERIVIRGH